MRKLQEQGDYILRSSIQLQWHCNKVDKESAKNPVWLGCSMEDLACLLQQKQS